MSKRRSGGGRGGRGGSGRGGGARSDAPPRRGAPKDGASKDGERLQKLLSRAGLASRRTAETWIAAGRVTVNGVVASIGDRARPGDDVRLDGHQVVSEREHVTYLLHKPTGVVSAVRDDRGRRTVIDLLPPEAGLHPVGRLDLDSEGLLLVTTDGDLTLRLTHPRYGHEKEYRLWCREGTVDGGALRQLVNGIALDDGSARARSARPVDGGCVLVLGDGRKRQARRMLAAVGYRVTRLLRTRVDGLRLGDLPPGSYRRLTADEVERLRGR